MTVLTSTLPDGFSRPGADDPVFRFQKIMVDHYDLQKKIDPRKEIPLDGDGLFYHPPRELDPVFDLAFWQALSQELPQADFDQVYDQALSQGYFGKISTSPPPGKHASTSLFSLLKMLFLGWGRGLDRLVQ